MDRTLRRPGSPYPNQMEFTGYKASVPGAGDNIPMIQTAENLAVRYSLTREGCDAFVLGSHQKAAEAWEKGWFADQVVPVTVPQKKGDPKVVTMDTDRFEAAL